MNNKSWMKRKCKKADHNYVDQSALAISNDFRLNLN